MSDRDDFYAALHDDLRVFIEWAFAVLNPGLEYKHGWHIDAIIYQLMKCYRGETRRLLITMPPRSLKSQCVSVAFVAWVLGRHPERKFICASYGEKPGDLLAQQTRTLMEHPDYHKAFPKMQFAQVAPLDMMNTKLSGYRMTTSVGGPATAFGTDFVIADDLTKADASEGERAKACGFYQSSLMSRFNDKATGVAIVVAQRTAVDDLPGFLLAQGGYEHLNLPAVALADRKIEIGPNKHHMYRAGELLHETRENKETLELVRRDLGDAKFAAQYLQNPMLGGQALFKSEYFPRYDKVYPRHGYEYVLQTWDCGASLNEGASFSVCMTFGVRENKLHLLHVSRKRREYPDLKKAARSLIDFFEPSHVCIEKAALGLSLYHDLSAEYGTGITSDSPRVNKVERAEAVMHLVNAGRVLLPKGDYCKPAFRDDLERELFAFPDGPYDDQVDALVIALRFMERNCFAWVPLNYADRPPSRKGFAHLVHRSDNGDVLLAASPTIARIKRADELRDRYGHLELGR